MKSRRNFRWLFCMLCYMYRDIVNRYIIGVLVVCFLGCTEPVAYQYQVNQITTKETEICDDQDCPEIDISYLVFEEPKVATAAINQTLKIACINLLEEPGQSSETVQQAVDNYINNSQTAYPEDLVISGQYEIQIDQHVLYQSDDLLSVKMEYYSAQGGAHGYGGVQYHNFDPATGLQRDQDMYFSDIDGFLSLAKAKFYEHFNLSEQDGLSEKGFSFNEDKFHLPEQIGFSEEGVYLTYNAYEVASYATGIIEIVIPLAEAESFLNFF